MLREKQNHFDGSVFLWDFEGNRSVSVVYGFCIQKN